MFSYDMFSKKTTMPTVQTALEGRGTPMPVSGVHFVNGRRFDGPVPEGLETVYLGMGCFWGAERLLWKTPGVWVTAVGYSGGLTPNPTYEETTTGLTGHTEVVKVVYDPREVPFARILKLFFEEHDPTQGMRQGNDIGTTYRSAIYTTGDAQLEQARSGARQFGEALGRAGHGAAVTTEIAPVGDFYYAEEYHQQYLAKNPGGYCGLRGTGVTCAIDG